MNSKNINEVANSQSKKRSSGQQNNVNGNTSSNTSVDGTTRNNHNVKKKNGLAGRIENDIETDRKINRPYAKRKEK